MKKIALLFMLLALSACADHDPKEYALIQCRMLSEDADEYATCVERMNATFDQHEEQVQ